MDKNKKYILILVTILFIIVLFSFINGGKAPAGKSEKMTVAASFYPLYFFSSQIGGDKANVTNITPAGAEPHDYEPTSQDMVTISNSDLLVLNGGGLEAWGDKIMKNSSSREPLIIVAGKDLTDQKVVEDGENITDPHIWLSPELAEKIVDKITDGFIGADPKNKDLYLANANTLKNKLSVLDADYRTGLQDCASRNIITSHSAFGYLATTYGFNQVSITGLSPDAEPSPKQLIDIAKFAKENKIKYIFFESLVSPKLSETVANEIGAQTMVLNPIEGLTNEEIKEGKDYLTEMQKNLASLRIALECK